MENEIKKPLEILVVEDKEENIKAAQEFFNTKRDIIHVDYAIDYVSASKLFEDKKYDACITDLYFPYEKGSMNKELGKKLFFDIFENYCRRNNKHPLYNGKFPFSGKEAEELLNININNNEQYTDLLKQKYSTLEFSDAYTIADLVLLTKDSDEDLQPLGFDIAKKSFEMKIPYTLISGGHGVGNGAKTAIKMALEEKNLINRWKKYDSWVAGDCDSEYGAELLKNENKDIGLGWKRALQSIEYRIKLKNPNNKNKPRRGL